ncbi:MAG: tRNA lysidine(34) synthetase TilS [Deltaproteobacteria bacterium]|nr:tRNA lysidine(34) synthetase TilS [Deltaproteobacteria bacterium]
MDLPQKVKKLITREGLITPGDRVLLAISGGIDSVSLFHILRELRAELSFELELAHINHGLRKEESDRDESFVRELAQEFRIPLHVERVDVYAYMKNHGMSVQHAARDLRYKSLFAIAERGNHSRIAVAHTLDDQVETFLLRVLKGTGLRGISSIPLRRSLIIRPFLYVERFEIERYIREKGFRYVEDSSNKKLCYERNYLRHRVIPLLYKLNPLFKQKIVALLDDLSRVNETFNEKADKFLKNSVIASDNFYTVQIEKLRLLDPETRFRVVGILLEKLNDRFIVQRNHMELIEKLLVSQRPSAFVKLPLGLEVRRCYEKLIFGKFLPEERVDLVLPLVEGTNPLGVFKLEIEVRRFEKGPDFDPRCASKMVAYLDGEKARNISVRTFREGDRFIPFGLKEWVKLKDFFIRNKVPRWQRRKIPIVVSDGEIAWVVGMRIDERFKITDRTKTVLELKAYAFDDSGVATSGW